MKKTIWFAVAVVVLGLGAALYQEWPRDQAQSEPPRQDVSSTSPTAAPQAGVEPAIKHPIEAAPSAALPKVDESDSAMQDTLTGLLGGKEAEPFYPDRVIRRIVATIDNLPRKQAGMKVMPVKPVSGAFITEGTGGDIFIGTKNAARYQPYVAIMQAVDARKLVDFYVGYYPLFQQAYVELGFPQGYFNDRLIEAIDNLLDAPDLKEPIKLLQPKVLYVFADPSLEERSAGQKILMRMGVENAAKVKAKLREIRQEVLLRAPKQ